MLQSFSLTPVSTLAGVSLQKGAANKQPEPPALHLSSALRLSCHHKDSHTVMGSHCLGSQCQQGVAWSRAHD